MRAFSVDAKLEIMGADWLALLERNMLGRSGEIVRREFDWAMNLTGGGIVTLPTPWRIIANGGIAFADRDDGQMFGLPAALDGEAWANPLIQGQPITKVTIDPETADLTIYFGHAARLDAFNHSVGYEGWQIGLPLAHGTLSIIAMGGGDLAISIPHP